MIAKRIFLFEAIRNTLFCIVVVVLFSWYGSNEQTLMIVLNISAMACLANFFPQRKPSWFVLFAASVAVLAVAVGGSVGFHFPIGSKVLAICLAGCAFYFSKREATLNATVTAVVTFFCFLSLPYQHGHVGDYLLYAGIIAIAYAALHHLVEGKIYANLPMKASPVSPHRFEKALLVVVSLIVGEAIVYLFQHHTQIVHLYWIPLTIMLVIRGSHEQTVKRSLWRILANTAGAVLMVWFLSWLPKIFWLNCVILFTFLFVFFTLGFCYVWRTVVVELFIIMMIYMLDHSVVAYDRVILTITGGAIVIVVSLLVRLGMHFKRSRCCHPT